jgi:VIT1/CCC1 family predicted Fe2+/Mn2+ transporter
MSAYLGMEENYLTMDPLNNKKIRLKDVILGGQDGLVNVLGISLGLFAAHAPTRIILIAGLAAGFSEAVSMGAVAFTSARADKEIVRQKTTNALIFSSFIVFSSALIGSLAPLIPFLFFPIMYSIVIALFIGASILFILGFTNARQMGNNKIRGGSEILLIGFISAFAGFAIGLLLKVN